MLLGMSFSAVLASFNDLVICMDEAHRYYAPASMKAINFLKPVLGLEYTATPKSTSNVIYSYDLARGAVEGYLKTPVVMGRSNMAGYSAADIEEMKRMFPFFRSSMPGTTAFVNAKEPIKCTSSTLCKSSCVTSSTGFLHCASTVMTTTCRM